MIPRGVLDVGFRTLLAAACSRGSPVAAPNEATAALERVWDSTRPVVAALSLRSGFDATLAALDWPAGSEILVSAVTIPDMIRVIESRGLVAAPLDVDPRTLAPDVASLSARVTPRTRAILIAHLFGSRAPLDGIAAFARERGLLLFEDAAQAHAGDDWRGDDAADATFFSFGTIKAQTALGGGLVRFRDQRLAAECRAIRDRWPVQPAGEFRRKAVHALALAALATRPAFTAATAIARAAGVDLDERLAGAVRGFRADRFWELLRRSPCPALCELLRRRVERPDRRWIDRKTELAEAIVARLPRGCVLGDAAHFPSRWVLPIVSRDPGRLRERLVGRGYDATSRASRLRVAPAPVDRPEWTTPTASGWSARTIYLPLHPAMRRRHVEEMTELIARFEADAGA